MPLSSQCSKNPCQNSRVNGIRHFHLCLESTEVVPVEQKDLLQLNFLLGKIIRTSLAVMKQQWSGEECAVDRPLGR